MTSLAEAATISGAAEKLKASPSALSTLVTELERSLQTQLLQARADGSARVPGPEPPPLVQAEPPS